MPIAGGLSQPSVELELLMDLPLVKMQTFATMNKKGCVCSRKIVYAMYKC